MSRSSSAGWTSTAAITALIVCLPLLSLVYLAITPDENIWGHLVDTVLPRYLSTTFLLMALVAIGTTLIGVTSAWLVTHYEFPGRKLFTWALLLPFAVPAYVLAYIYTDLLEFAGPVQSTLRDWFGWNTRRDYYFPSIRTLGGAASMLVLVLYPYVYLLARAAFLEQSSSLLEAAQLLGKSRLSRFFRVALPLARPAIVVGVSMALMETLNDFGTVSFFAVQTLTLGVYDVWLGMGNLGGAAQIALLPLVIVTVLLVAEKYGRRKQNAYQPGGSRFRPLTRHTLNGWPAIGIVFILCLPILLGFVIPLINLVYYAIVYFEESWTSDFRLAAWHSLSLSAMAALITIAIGLLLSYALRLGKGRWLPQLVQFSTLGYAIPGVVLAIGIMIPFGRLDNTIDAFFREYAGFSTGLIFSGTLFALLFAYSTRFLAVAFGSVDASLKKIHPCMDEAARSLGRRPLSILATVHLPLIKSGLLTGALVVFVDCMKELPATLVMRPFNYETLATQVYQFASDELIEQSALGALLIVATGLLPVVLISKSIDEFRQAQTEGVRQAPSTATPKAQFA